MQNEPNFFRLRPIHNLHKNKELQQKMNNGHLVKTNPIKPVFQTTTLPDLSREMASAYLTGTTLSPPPDHQPKNEKRNQFSKVKDEHKLSFNKELRK
jgi:hypothetical protein